jgi:hypothetical protein
MTVNDEELTEDRSASCRAQSKCSCGGWLILAGSSFVGPTGYLIRRRCLGCRTWVVDEKTHENRSD